MIITCEQCKTRFKVPDEKISVKGVKVRCAKCQHTFRVARAAEPTPEDPFGLFGPSQPGGSVTPTPVGGAFDDPPTPAVPADWDMPLGPPGAAEGQSLDFDHSLFAMPAPPTVAPAPSPAAAPAPAPPRGGLLDEIPDLTMPPGPAFPSQPANGLAGLSPAPLLPRPITVETPAAFQPPAPVSWGLRLVRVVVAAALLALLAAAAVVVLNDGALPRPQDLLRRARASGITADVLASVYETQSGRILLFVRGEALNRGDRPARMRVRVEVLDGAQVLRVGEVLAGALATPEELFRISTAGDADALRSKLEAQAKALSPGSRAPFLVPFYDIPQDGIGLSVRVSAEPELESVQAVHAGG